MKKKEINKTSVFRSCPLCGENNPPVKRSKRKWKRNDIEYFSYISISECKKCELKYQNPLLDQNEVSDIYKNNYIGNEVAQKERYETKFKINNEASTWFLKYIKNKEKKILIEIGASSGYNIANVAKSTKFRDIIGYDLDKESVEFGKKMGNNLTSKDFFGDSKKPNVVMLFHILEHIPDPINFLKSIISKSQEDLIFIINVPNSFMWGERASIEHVNYFSEKSIKILMEKIGMKVSKIGTTMIHPKLHNVAEIRSFSSKVNFDIDYKFRGLKPSEIRRFARDGYEMAYNAEQKQKYKKYYKDNSEGKKVSELLFWSKAYRIFTFKWLRGNNGV